MNAGLCVKGDNDNTKKKKRKKQIEQFPFFSTAEFFENNLLGERL